MFSIDVREKIVARESFGSWEEYAENYQEHLAFREEQLPAFIAEEFGDAKQMRSISLVLKQALVHRAIDLFEGAVNAAASNNFYSMTLPIRGHFETTASLGYFHSRLDSLRRGTIDAVTFHQDVDTQILGSRAKGHPESPGAKHILTMLEYADKSVSIHILKGLLKERDMLMDSYMWLSEFCHPNFHSCSVSIDVDNVKLEFRFRHGEPMRDRECKVLEYLLISGKIFVALFEKTGELISENFG